MLILPDRTQPVGRIVQPHHRRLWSPSQSPLYHSHGDRTRYAIVARYHDGWVKWRGIFEDREDADAFLCALAAGSLNYEKELWRLPRPEWSPDVLGDIHPSELLWEFVSQTALTASPGSNQTWTIDATWNDANNTVDTIGGGASGGKASSGHGTGGGGGACNEISNLALGGVNPTYQIGIGGPSVSTAGNGNDGGDTWFKGTTIGGSSVGSKGGVHGVQGSGSQNGGAGGVAASGQGTAKGDGGRGGNLTGASGRGGSGGGGAGGINGAGQQGVDSSSTSTTSTNGGAGDAGSGGAGGVVGGTATGGNGNEWTIAGVGSGGGGAGRASSSGGATAAAGGNYGGAGGGNSPFSGTGNSGAGIQGVIVLTWTVAIFVIDTGNPILPAIRRTMIPYH